MAYYIFNFLGDPDEAVRMLRSGMWGVDADERHGGALAAGDLVLVYVGAPERTFIGRAELAQPCPGGVLLAGVEEWDPPVPMSAVLSQIDRSAGARADFDAGVVAITADEYATAVAVAARR